MAKEKTEKKEEKKSYADMDREERYIESQKKGTK